MRKLYSSRRSHATVVATHSDFSEFGRLHPSGNVILQVTRCDRSILTTFSFLFRADVGGNAAVQRVGASRGKESIELNDGRPQQKQIHRRHQA